MKHLDQQALNAIAHDPGTDEPCPNCKDLTLMNVEGMGVMCVVCHWTPETASEEVTRREV